MAGVICREIFGLFHVGLIRVLLFKEQLANIHNMSTTSLSCREELNRRS